MDEFEYYHEEEEEHFESQYEDELEVMRELELEESERLKSKFNAKDTAQPLPVSFSLKRGPDCSGVIEIEAVVESGLLKKRRTEIPVNESSIIIANRQPISEPEETISVTPSNRANGKRVFLRLKPLYDLTTFTSGGTRKLALLPVCVNELRVQAEECYLQRLLNGPVDEDQPVESIVDVERVGKTVNLGAMWTDKYRPTGYVSLLSDDSINRELLRWLKLWDFCVFGKISTIKSATETKSKFPFSFKNKDGSIPPGKFVNYPQINNLEVDTVDQYKRPVRKIVLLCGPPGHGKTTLAHVIARHCGYQVVEMNASDDRTAEVFKRQLETSTQMRSCLGLNQKPNCLVMDEIDGAPAVAIETLVSMVTASSKKQPDTSFDEPKTKKKAKAKFNLLRPIICICNDAFAPALRSLKTIAVVLSVPVTVTSRLASRLMDVCRMEGVLADTAAMLVLCEKSGCDVRNCLMTLQFLVQKQRHASLGSDRKTSMAQLTSALRTVSVGQKDSQNTVWDVWRKVHTLPRADQEQTGTYGRGEKMGSKGANRVWPVWKVVQTCGEYEKVYGGLFENYLSVKRRDPGLKSVWHGTEWLCYTDMVQRWINVTQDYHMMAYLPTGCAGFHLLYATATPHKFVYPQLHSQSYQKNLQTTSTVNTVLSSTSSMRTIYNSHSLIADVIPFVLYIIRPVLRPLNAQLYSQQELDSIRRLVGVMVEFGLSYEASVNAQGSFEYNLLPDIECIVSFGDSCKRRELTYATKQLIAREVEMERVRRREGIMAKAVSAAGELVKPESTKPIEVKVILTEKQPVQLSKQIKKPIAEKGAVDFFGRAIVPKTAVANTMIPGNGGTGGASNVDAIWYQFKEGMSNAVRHDITIAQLLDL